jgi:hypothetical protein
VRAGYTDSSFGGAAYDFRAAAAFRPSSATLLKCEYGFRPANKADHAENAVAFEFSATLRAFSAAFR